MQIIGKTYKGLEDILAKEIQDLGGKNIEIGRRAISFEGNKTLLYKANLCCRTATRFLMPIASFSAKNADELYEQTKKIDWTQYMNVKTTFLIDSTVYSESFTHSQFVSYRVKDAIADFFMDKEEKRPSVNLSNPDIIINIHISDTTCTISLDSSGESLHKRGYRKDQTEAPISEVLAAGMLLMAGWDGQSDFIDPMCGSGTILIEAALIALNIPPGIFRKEFAFERWNDFDKDLFDEIYNDDSYERDFEYKIYGSDLSKIAIKIAEENIKNAGLNKYICLQQKNIAELELEKNHRYLMVTNPPYGERIKPTQIHELYRTIGSMLKHQMTGNDAWIISSEEDLLSQIGMKPSIKKELINGALNCLFCKYEIFSGSRKDHIIAKIKRGEYKKEPKINRDRSKDYQPLNKTRAEKQKDRRRFFLGKNGNPGGKSSHGNKRFYSNKPTDKNYGGKQ
ncbi:MAG: class I SAM-dependent RNA methyltransferase [Paludibacteraceae bacterium]|nr:class I SAM-dependent RNA methyltransferase [Paludibacteraceae bacterium]